MERTLKLSFELLKARRPFLVKETLNITSKGFITCCTPKRKNLESDHDVLPSKTSNMSTLIPHNEATGLHIFGSKENKGGGEPMRPVFTPPAASHGHGSQIEPPTNCCMSGCPNCVWIDYAEALTESFSTSNKGKERLKEELNQISDENIKAYIMMELRVRGLL